MSLETNTRLTDPAAEPVVVIEVWSDIACPWCYIGKRRFATALEQFAHREPGFTPWGDA